MAKKKRTMDELRQVKTFGYRVPLPKNKPSTQNKDKKSMTIDSAIEGWSDKIEVIITKIDSMIDKLDKIINAIDNMK